jgi:predicted site-specific integrase-resolvase
VSGKKLSDWARENGVHYRTAMVWLHNGTLPVQVTKTPGGHYRVTDAPAPVTAGKSVVYGRVSSHDQKADLERQMQRLRCFASGLGLQDVKAVEEIGSGLNGKRPKLLNLSCLLIHPSHGSSSSIEIGLLGSGSNTLKQPFRLMEGY